MAEAVPTTATPAASPVPAGVPSPSAAVPSATAPAAPGTPVDPKASAAPPVEAKTEEPKKPSAKEWEEIRKQQAATNRREAALRQVEKAVKDGKAALEADAALVKADPLAFAKKHGISPDDLIQRIALGEETVATAKAEPTPLENDVAALKKDKEDRERTAAQQNQEQVINGFKTEIATLAPTLAEKYDLVAPVADFLNTKPAELIFSIIQEHFRRTESAPGSGDGELWQGKEGVEKACEVIQKYYEKRAEGLAKLPRWKAQPAAPETPGGDNGKPAPAGTTGKPEVKPGAPAPTTLNNAATAAPSVGGGEGPRTPRGPLAIDDAIAAFLKR